MILPVSCFELHPYNFQHQTRKETKTMKFHLFPIITCLAAMLAAPVANAQMNPRNESMISDTATEIAGEFAVEPIDGLSSADLKQLRLDYDLHDATSLTDEADKIEVGDVAPDQEDATIARLRHDPRVKFAEHQHVFRATGFVPNDPMYDQQWNMKRVHAVDSWNYSTGAGSIVAVIDTGVQEDISDLQGARFLKGYNFADDNEDTRDPRALHGTHVSGTVVSVPNNQIGVIGLSYASTILPVKALDDRGSGTMAGVALAIRYATDRGANVINMSLGASQSDNLTREAVEYALSKNVVVVAAAGNNGDDLPHYPSAYPGVISVSATDENDQLAKFSSRGKQVVVAAPGVNVLQQVSDGSFKAFNGTSMASPHTASLASQVVALGLRGEAVKDAITSTADKKPGQELLFGAGIINALKTTRAIYYSHFFWRLGLLLGLVYFVKRRINKFGGSYTKTGTLAALLTSTGLVPLVPFTGVLPRMGSLHTVAELAMRPLGEWDLLYSANVHAWLPLASIIPVLAFGLLAYSVKSLRGSIGGMALGTAAYLSQQLISNDLSSGIWFRLYLAVSTVVCVLLARSVLDSKFDSYEDIAA
jgi:serine protease